MPPSLPPPSHAVTRRRVAGGLLAAPALMRKAVAAPAELRITAYDGFVPAAFQRRFEAETGTPIRVRLAASQAPELALLATEREAPITDLCTVTGNRLHQFAEAGIIEPLDRSRLRNWDRLDPRYAGADWNMLGGETMAVPLVIGANVLVSDTREVRPAPESWEAMFDPRWRGRTTCDVEDFLLCTMLLQGADPTFVSYGRDRAAAKRAVDAARDRMIAAKPQVVRYFDEGGELQQLLLGGDAVLAQTYSSVPSRLIVAGQPFRRTVPREGSMAFVYTLAVVRGGPNRDAAYRYLDSMLGMPDAAAVLSRSTGYLSAFRDAGAGLSAAERAAYGLPEDALGRLRFPRFEGQALSSALVDRAVEEVKAA